MSSLYMLVIAESPWGPAHDMFKAAYTDIKFSPTSFPSLYLLCMIKNIFFFVLI